MNILSAKLKLRATDVLQITEQSLQSHESCAKEELIQIFLQKLLINNYRARCIKTERTNDLDQIQMSSDSPEDESDIFDDVLKSISLCNKATSQNEQIHSMDLQMAVFYSADGFLKQLMVTKLSQCQYALPLLVPDPFTKQIEFPLWTFRQINKKWKIKNTNISQTQPIYKAKTPMVFFFRFCSVSSSKSQLINNLINEKHNTFFHRNCPGSTRTRELMDGVVEIAWYCPSGTDTDKFTDCVAFCNLHGDAGDHEKQLHILTEMASVNVVLLSQFQKNDRNATLIQSLYRDRKLLICIFTEDESALIEMKKRKFKIGLKDRNQSDVSEELRIAINDYLSDSCYTFRPKDVSKYSGIRIDEEDDDDCRRGRDAAQQMMSLLEKKDLAEIKESFLPHQKLYHQWCQKNKELHRSQANETDMDKSKKHSEMKKIREQQHQYNVSEFMKKFIKEIGSHAANEKLFFLKWLRILLDEYTSADLSALHNKYDAKWSTIMKLRENCDKSEEIKAEQAELEKISEELQAATFGLEHIMREISQIYESCSFVNKNKKDLQVCFSSLASLVAEMMISGFPMELMDGDAAHVPVIWISAVLDELIQKLGDQRIFVLSVLGIQSSGKSTMLNAMFGLEFAVSAGRCTRGAFMQLVRVSNAMKKQLKFDYILVVDTEGLHAQELAGRSTRHHDNELATFVIGFANLTLINIFGENPAEMEDILQIVVQAFMRMKKCIQNCSCIFVHQNVSDIAAEERTREGRRQLQEKLDKMTKLTAEEEDCDAECFSDVIRFDVQNDVKYFAPLWEGSPPMAPPNPKYCENIQELKKTIASHVSKSDGIMLKDLKNRIIDLWEALLKEQFVFSFRNSLEISSFKKLKTEYSTWSWTLRSAMMEAQNKLLNKIENKAINEIEEIDLRLEMKNTIEEVKKSMSEFFERDKYIPTQWKTSFEIKIKGLQENIVRETKKKLKEVLYQQNLNKKSSSQGSHHENTLNEESKEVVPGLKDDDCIRMNEAAQHMMSLLKNKCPKEIKDYFLPCHGKLWHQWSQKNKEVHRPQVHETKTDISRKQTEMNQFRQQQHEFDISEFMKIFIKETNSNAPQNILSFLKILRIVLDENTSADLSNLHHKYTEKWSTVLKLKQNCDKSEKLKVEQAELEKISEDLQDATFGLEHIMREVGQIYESCSAVKKNKKDLQIDFSSLPSLAAEIMISGFPVEMMDGDAAHVPLVWISAVLDELIQKLGDQRVFVLSVLGVQSSGKSTMLNALFGLSLAVSAGRCTRGAFMQLVKVSNEMKVQLNFDYFLVLDTEGLRAQELAEIATRQHDNELATFVIGLANLTLINVFGETTTDMQDILQIVVQAFMRMKKVRLNPSCVFVHQNVTDITAGERNMEGRRRLQETLDETTKLAAKEEDYDAERFSDVIKFDVQNDVKYVAQLWEGSPPMAPPNPNYCENIQDLKKYIICLASKSHGMVLNDLNDHIKDLWEALLNERFVFSFRNSREISAYRKLETNYSKWSWMLYSTMIKIENKLHNKIQNEAIHEIQETDLQREMMKTSEEVEKSMSEFFEKNKDKDTLINWKTSFEIKVKEFQKNIVRETMRKLSEIINQRDLNKNSYSQKEHNENTLCEMSKECALNFNDKTNKDTTTVIRTDHEKDLFEKSKELSLKLKGKTNYEKEIQKEFDLLWNFIVDNIISDTHTLELIKDVSEILSDERCLPVDMKDEDILSFTRHLKKHFYKKKTKCLCISFKRPQNKLTSKNRSLITDIVHQTDQMIQSFNISKMGYNISHIQKLTDYINTRVTEHQEKHKKYVFENEFFTNIVYYICEKSKQMITDQHRKFREAYVENKREEYYNIFQKYCHGATSAVTFGEIICQKLKKPIELSVYKKTSRDLADEMRTNCKSLNENRSKLEKNIMKTIEEEEDFEKYMDYIKNPRNHLENFIRDEVSQYINIQFSLSVLPKMKKNIELLQQKIMKAANESTEKVNSGDVSLWLKSFTLQLSDELIFSEKDLSGVKHDDVGDFHLLEDVIKKEIHAIMSNISSSFNPNTFPVNLDNKFRPDEFLIDHICQCSWV